MHHSVAESTIKRIALVAGVVTLICGVAMSFEYGRAMSYTHAVLLAMLGVGGAIAFSGADMMRARGRNLLAGIITGAGVLCLIGEYTTHFGYTVGSRATDTQQTMVLNASYKAVQDNREAEKANLDMWRKQLADLMSANAWAATVKADGLRAQLESHDKAIQLETERGGCKSKCLQLMKEKGKLEERIGIVEQQADLSKRIEATQRILDRKVESAAKTEFRSSKIINQSIGFAQISTGEIEPSATAIGWVQIILGAVIALFTTFLAPLFLQIAMPDLSGRRSQAEIQRSLSSVAKALEAPLQPHHHPRGEGARDTRFDELLSRVRQFQMRTA
jgi:hypothetical protein